MNIDETKLRQTIGQTCHKIESKLFNNLALIFEKITNSATLVPAVTPGEKILVQASEKIDHINAINKGLDDTEFSLEKAVEGLAIDCICLLVYQELKEKERIEKECSEEGEAR